MWLTSLEKRQAIRIEELEEEIERLRKVLVPLANAKRARWAWSDSSTPPFVVSESATRKAKTVLIALKAGGKG